jgi:hypothetical protein
VRVGTFTDRPADEYHAVADGCGPLAGISLQPPGTPTGCDWHLPWASRACSVGGGLVWKALSPASTSAAHISATLAEPAPVCARPVTVLLHRTGGQPVMEGRLARAC